MTEGFDVGGVRLPRPFRIRRLGHFGFNCDRLEDSLVFYRDALGFRLSDTIDFTVLASDPNLVSGLGDTNGYFMRHGTDHHSFVLFNRRVREALDTTGRFRPGVTLNQITWQVGSLEEVVRGGDYLQGRGVPISRSGRDTPGSNWHSYFIDPDGHTVELYYGIEQVGWTGRSKPKPMYNRGYRIAPPLPQVPEEVEVADALSHGVDLDAGFAPGPSPAHPFEVEGLRLPRPFVVVGIGPVRIFAADTERARAFYEDELGLLLTERRRIEGFDALFFRCGGEHHSLAVYDLGLRRSLPVRQDTSSFSFGVRLGSYSQLRAAVAHLEAAGYKRVELSPELSPGIRHCAFFADPDGHLVQLLFEMEQVGWSGRPRTPAVVPASSPAQWPETIEPWPETYSGEVFMGPWL